MALLLRVGAKQKRRGMLKIIISGYKNFLFHFLKRIYKCVFVFEDDLELLILLILLLPRTKFWDYEHVLVHLAFLLSSP